MVLPVGAPGAFENGAGVVSAPACGAQRTCPRRGRAREQSRAAVSRARRWGAAVVSAGGSRAGDGS